MTAKVKATDTDDGKVVVYLEDRHYIKAKANNTFEALGMLVWMYPEEFDVEFFVDVNDDTDPFRDDESGD